MKYYDQHTHSAFSEDSNEDLRNYYLCAIRDGVDYVCTCEHFDFETIMGKTWSADFDSAIKYREELKKEFPNITPLLGVELGYKPTAYKVITDLACRYPFDIIQLSIHDNNIIDYYFPEQFGDYYETLNGYFDLMLDGVTNFDNYDVLSHLDYGFKTCLFINKNLKLSEFEGKIKKILEVIIKKGKALEVNSKVQNKIYEITNNYDNLEYLLKLYKSMGGEKITLSSDAHEVKFYRSNFSLYMDIIKKNGFNKLSYYIKRKEYFYDID